MSSKALLLLLAPVVGALASTSVAAAATSAPTPRVNLAPSAAPSSKPLLGREPNRLVLGRGGATYIYNLDWGSWGQQQANGGGLYYSDSCKPDCAKGTVTKEPVFVVLNDPVNTSKGRVFSRLTYQGANGTKTSLSVWPAG